MLLLLNHIVGRFTRQRWLNPHDAHTWHRCLHHDGIAKLDTVHGGRTEGSKIISVVSTDALGLNHKPVRVTTENLRVSAVRCSANYFIIQIICCHLRPIAEVFRMSAPRLRPFTATMTDNYQVLIIIDFSSSAVDII